MASCSRVTFAEIIEEVLASDWEISSDDDECVSDEDSTEENTFPINSVGDSSLPNQRTEACFRGNLLQEDLNHVSCATKFVFILHFTMYVVDEYLETFYRAAC